jgi:hypothetical protein
VLPQQAHGGEFVNLIGIVLIIEGCKWGLFYTQGQALLNHQAVKLDDI